MEMQFEEFLLEVKKEIDELVDREIFLKSKSAHPIDEQAIWRAKAGKVINDYATCLDDWIKQGLPLGELLKKDSIEIYEKLKSSAGRKNLLTPQEIKELTAIGSSYFEKKQYDKARLYFILLVFLDPSNAHYYFLKARAEQNMKHYAEAIGSYFTAISLDPKPLLPYLQIIECLILNKNIQEAKQIYASLEKHVHQSAAYESKIKTIKNYLTKVGV
jgi:tetratricopeptide (TPR) repeat protein